jgi:hypothetical protein
MADKKKTGIEAAEESLMKHPNLYGVVSTVTSPLRPREAVNNIADYWGGVGQKVEQSMRKSGQQGNVYGIADYAASSINAQGGYMPTSPKAQQQTGKPPSAPLTNQELVSIADLPKQQGPTKAAPLAVAQAKEPAAQEAKAPAIDAPATTGDGYRIIRQPGKSPILTNVADPNAEIARGKQFIDTGANRLDINAPIDGKDVAAVMSQPQAGPSAWWLRPGAENSPQEAGTVSRLRSNYNNLLGQGIPPAEAIRQSELQDRANVGGVAGRMSAEYHQDQDRKNREARAAQEKAGIDSLVGLAKADAYTAAAEKDRYEASPEYVAASNEASGAADQQKFMEKLISTNENLYKEILGKIAEHPEGSSLPVSEQQRLAREQAWEATRNSFVNIAGLFGSDGEPTSTRGERLKQAFTAYKTALDNLDARLKSGQVDEKEYNREYQQINQAHMDAKAKA